MGPVTSITVDNLLSSESLASFMLWYACVVDNGVYIFVTINVQQPVAPYHVTANGLIYVKLCAAFVSSNFTTEISLV